MVPVTASPLTTARIIRQSTSSITAAPRMTRASSVVSFPKSRNTRAVIPTLVAVRIPPINRSAARVPSGCSNFMVPMPSKHREDNTQHGDIGGRLSDTAHFNQADFQPDKEQQD